MILNFQEIEQFILSDTPDWIKKSRKYTKKLDVHINGNGVADYLDSITGFENDSQYELRKKYATSNKFVFKNLLRPVDKVFSANGGSREIKTSTETSKKLLDTKISAVRAGMPLRKFISNVQSNKYYSDPSGLIFFEWDQKDLKPTFKSINVIKNYYAKGRRLEFLLFEGEKRKKQDGEEIPGNFYRFVDDSGDYIYKELDGKVSLLEDETFENPWNYVPAIVNSDILNETLEYHISPVDEIIELADHYLRTTSVKNIYEFLHGYPIFWAYVEKCRTCDGTGTYDGGTCTTCHGDGHTFKKDVSDVLKLMPPTASDQPVLAPDVAGYVQPDLETWREQRTELDWLERLMQFAMWGTTHEASENDTATAAFLDVQPVNDRLNKFADAFEETEKLMIDIIGAFIAKENYKGASVNYGRRFLVESPDKIWKKYQEAREKGAPDITLNYLLIQFYQSEFKNDIANLTKAEKGIKLEPFIHKSVDEVLAWNIPDEVKKQKIYFSEWWETVKDEDILTKDVEILKQNFEQYLLTKNLSDGQEVQRIQSSGTP